ncbi:hypothetical protein PoB_004268200 [Plakobranchus ocellatus]|uniref:Uncharacterized protein n=1 Tax=Plakobranchus ocellatus TaxID=259542 RepID=A0AAV4B9T3_9GAST|nr:hypothetical protein PoB_004268200 [Plakobranchus ocellatus]
MAFRAVVVAALVALASAGMDPGYMNMMGGGMMNQMMNMNMHGGGGGGNGCNQGSGGAGCQLPQGMDMSAYLQQQAEQQQYETQQMAEKIKAQFEQVMRDATMRKHRYAMSVMTEFTSMCACAEQAFTIYQSMFVENARTLNLTDVVDLSTMNMRPYEAKSAREARELIFAGVLRALCTSLGEYFNFVQSVEDNLQILEGNRPVTTPAVNLLDLNDLNNAFRAGLFALILKQRMPTIACQFVFT